MREILEQSNVNLLHEIERLRVALQSVAGSIPEELDKYYAWAVAFCDQLHNWVTQNLQYLNLGQDNILPDILSNTQDITLRFQFFDQRLVTSVLRARCSDRLCLRLLSWLHSEHRQTKDVPAGLSDERDRHLSYRTPPSYLSHALLGAAWFTLLTSILPRIRTPTLYMS